MRIFSNISNCVGHLVLEIRNILNNSDQYYLLGNMTFSNSSHTYYNPHACIAIRSLAIRNADFFQDFLFLVCSCNTEGKMESVLWWKELLGTVHNLRRICSAYAGSIYQVSWVASWKISPTNFLRKYDMKRKV